MKAPGALRLLAVVSIVATGLGLAAPPAAATPGLIVTPATGLLDQQVVTVVGTGFAPRDHVVVAQCAGATLDGCALDPPVNTTAAIAVASPAGEVQVTLRPSRALELDGGDVSCLEASCAIVAVDRDSGEERARTAISFAATGAAPPVPSATLAVTIPDLRADGGTGTLTGSGFLPWFKVTQVAFGATPSTGIQAATGPADPSAYVALCTAGTGCRRFVSPETAVGSTGLILKFHQTVPVAPDGTVSHTREIPRMWTTEQGRVDCAVAGCRFALEQDTASTGGEIPWVPEWDPWPSASAFVAAVYPALVGRPATASERSSAIAGLTDRSLTGFTFLRRLAARSDGRRLAELTRLYQAALDRRPDGSGLLYWASELRRTGSMTAIAGAFGRSPEFRRALGPSVSDAEAVTRAYLRTLRREPSAGERSYWVGRLRAGLSRTHMIHLFSRTPEFLAREAGRSEVAAVTVALLRRGPTLGEWSASGPYENFRDPRTVSQRADDGVLVVVSSNQLDAEVG